METFCVQMIPVCIDLLKICDCLLCNYVRVREFVLLLSEESLCKNAGCVFGSVSLQGVCANLLDIFAGLLKDSKITWERMPGEVQEMICLQECAYIPDETVVNRTVRSQKCRELHI